MKKIAGKLILYIFLTLLTIITLAPILWVLISSLKTKNEMLTKPWGLPGKLMWTNYEQAWQRGNFQVLLKNSVTITFFALIFMVTLSAMVAFAISRYKIRLSRIALIYLLIGQTISTAMIVFPIVIILKKIGFDDSHTGLILTYIAGGLPFATFVMQGFFNGIPKEIYEAAEIDGSGEFSIFRSIALPLAKPSLATVLLYQFMWVWNEFTLSFTVINSTDKRSIIVGLYSVINGQLQTNYVLAFAGAVIVSLPIILIYLIFQKYLIQGLVDGSVKG